MTFLRDIKGCNKSLLPEGLNLLLVSLLKQQSFSEFTPLKRKMEPGPLAQMVRENSEWPNLLCVGEILIFWEWKCTCRNSTAKLSRKSDCWMWMLNLMISTVAGLNTCLWISPIHFQPDLMLPRFSLVLADIYWLSPAVRGKQSS